MALNHGINTAKSETNFATVTTGETGIPFYVGCWPCHRGGGYTGKPQIAFSFDEAKQLGGYSEEWRDTSGSPKWGLCQAMYAHFKVFGCAPAIFFNVFDPATHKSAVSSAPVAVEQHIAKLPVDALKLRHLPEHPPLPLQKADSSGGSCRLPGEVLSSDFAP